MKFDFVIGNPPYQETKENTFDKPVYNEFIDGAYSISNIVEVITPARFLFDNGNTPKEWNRKMLNNEHLKVLQYEANSKNIFNNTDIKGGIAITIYNKNINYGAIKAFTVFPELNSILSKVNLSNGASLSDIIYQPNRFKLDILYSDYPEFSSLISSDGKERRLTSSCFSKLNCFTDIKVNDDDIKIIGLMGNKRVWKYLPIKYIEISHPNLKKYKVIVPANNGSGAIGEVLSTPLIGTPLIGYTQTFIGIGSFDTEDEAQNAMKYIKSKFCRAMLGILKITQNGKKEVWKYVPLQNFTNDSDIDWSTSIKNIDKQLYKKYGLSQEEIDFIESKVQAME